MIAWSPCTPPGTVEKIGASTGYGKEIYSGCKEEEEELKSVVKLVRSRFLCGNSEAVSNKLGYCTARY